MDPGVYEPREDISYDRAFYALLESEDLEELFVESERTVEEILGNSKKRSEVYILEQNGSKEYWERTIGLFQEKLERKEDL